MLGRVTGSLVWNSLDDCLSLRSEVLRRHQRHVCSKHVDLMEFVSQSARNTVDLCQQLFAERRWNCSSIRRAPKFRRDLKAGKQHKYLLTYFNNYIFQDIKRDLFECCSEWYHKEWSLYYCMYKKAQLSLTNLRDAKACQKLLQFDVLTKRRWQYWPIFIRLAVVASEICKIPRNSLKIHRVQRHPMSSILVPMESPCRFLLVINCNFSRICYRFRDIQA